jgi:hypothetical protein
MLDQYIIPALLAADNPFTSVVTPVVSLLNMVITPALLLVGALGAIYCIILGVKLAKAEEQQDRDKAKNSLKNALIGFVSIFVLLVVLRLGLPAMSQWANTAAPTTSSSATN